MQFQTIPIMQPYSFCILICYIQSSTTTVLKNYMFGVPRIRNKRSLIRRQNENGRWYIMMKCGVFITRSIFSKMLTIDTQSSPVRARFGVFVVILISDSPSATVIAVSCVIPWSIRPRYSALDYISHCYLNLKFRPDGVCNVTKT